MPDVWNSAFADLHPCFQQLQNVRCWQGWDNWPACGHLGGILPQGLCAQSGQPVCFLPQDDTLPFPELYYEERIFQHGIVATRPNWHDFFNSLIWGVYSHTKVMINALHAQDIRTQGKPRTPQRDALTILDESGVILVATRRELLQLVQDFAWETLFWQERAAWGKEIGCFIIGHAMLEKMLTPYVGVTAHALLLEVNSGFFDKPLAVQQAQIDRMVANALSTSRLLEPDYLTPLPILGVPGWWDNDMLAFYQNSTYFRPKRRDRKVSIITE